MPVVTENYTDNYEDRSIPVQNWFGELLEPKNHRHSLPLTIFFIFIYSLIFVAGILGNFMVIFVFCRKRQMRSVKNMFILNLAMADLLVILFCTPVTLMTNIFVPWILGAYMCKGVTYIQGISVFASAYSLAVISVERCKSINRFLPEIKHLSKFKAVLIIAAIWITGFVTTLPWPIVFELTPIQPNGSTLFCVETWSDEFDGNMYFLFGNFLSCYAIPGVIICIANSQVFLRVSNRTVSVASAASRHVTNYHRRAKLGVKKLLSVVTLTFLLSWLPLYVVMFRVKFTSIESMSEFELNTLVVLIPIVQLLGISNSCANPFLYVYMNSRFREMLRSVFYTSLCSTLPCFEMSRRARNRQRSNRSIEATSMRVFNSVCCCSITSESYTSGESDSTYSSGSGSPESRQHIYQPNPHFFSLPSDRERQSVELIQAPLTLNHNSRLQMRLLRYSRETSV